jgi:hypothetical protein
MNPTQALGFEATKLSMAFKGLEYFASGPGIALAAAGAAFYVLSSRAAETEQNIRTFNIEIDAMGARGKNSGEQMQALAEHLRETGSSMTEATKMLQDLGRIPQVLGGGIELLTRITEQSRDIAAVQGGTAE